MRSSFPAPKIVCMARTFAQHAAELGNPVPEEPIFFLKAPSSVIGDGHAIKLPDCSEDVQHEAEVAIVIGQTICKADKVTAAGAIHGWTVLNDVTARDLQRADSGRFTRAKGFDTFCPMSDEILKGLDWRSLRIQCLVNGQMRQDGALTDLTFEPAERVSKVSESMTLMAGDVVSLGTPAGVGTIQLGDVVQVRMVDLTGQILLTLTNPVEAP